ncbi:prephenate dehydratase [Salinicoccus siamensis]|uniref:Prephenate dehydratase n=1 Tax=Salinicoccus siamensis TaxID=381830 RepID=A0ABV5Z325_9STAP
MLIGYQGTEGSYSALACKAFMGEAPYTTKGYATFKSLVDDMMRGVVDYIALPVENSTSGPITRTIDLMKYLEVSAVDEIYIKIDHALISKVPMDVGQVQHVYSHPEALEQCHGYLNDHPKMKPHQYSDTAEAVQMVKNDGADTMAAIAGAHAAALYNMHIISENISDNPLNTTRFLIFRKGRITDAGGDKTSLYIETDHSAGSLNEILNIFSTHSINLLNLTSRPIQHKPFSYGFFIDVETGTGDVLNRALNDVGKAGRYINILGAYRKGAVPCYRDVQC